MERIKHWNVDFKHFQPIEQIVNSKDFSCKQQELKCQNKKIILIPNIEILMIFKNLKILDLSHNLIVNVNSKNLMIGCPNLMKLCLDHNKIRKVEQVTELGKLEQLVDLDVSDNPFCDGMNRLNLMKKLMIIGEYPRMTIVSAIKSFYQSNVNMKVKNQYGSNNFKNDMNTKCGGNRDLNFSNLQNLNGSIVSIQDILNITGVNRIEEVFRKEQREKKEWSEQHKQYIENYQKRIKKKINIDEKDIQIREMNKYTENENQILQNRKVNVKFEQYQMQKDLRYLSKLDEIEGLKHQRLISNKKLEGLKVWNRPKPIDHVDFEYKIGIEQLKQENKDYEDQKHKRHLNQQQKDHKYRLQINQTNIRRKRIINIGKEHALDHHIDNDISLESDQEVRNVFKKAELKARMCRPKLNLAQGIDDEYGTEDSDLNEQNNSQMYIESIQNSIEQSDEDSIEQQNDNDHIKTSQMQRITKLHRHKTDINKDRVKVQFIDEYMIKKDNDKGIESQTQSRLNNTDYQQKNKEKVIIDIEQFLPSHLDYDQKVKILMGLDEYEKELKILNSVKDTLEYCIKARNDCDLSQKDKKELDSKNRKSRIDLNDRLKRKEQFELRNVLMLYKKNRQSIYDLEMTKEKALEYMNGNKNDMRIIRKIFEFVEKRRQETKEIIVKEKIKRSNKQVVLDRNMTKDVDQNQFYERKDYTAHIRKVKLDSEDEGDQEYYEDVDQRLLAKEQIVKQGVQYQDQWRHKVQFEGYFLKIVPKINEIIKKRIFRYKQLETFEEMVEASMKKMGKCNQRHSFADIDRMCKELREMLEEMRITEEENIIKRNDTRYCIREYVKLLRDDKKKFYE